MKYLFYPEIFWITNCSMDFFVFLLVRCFRKRKTSLIRLFLLSGISAFFSVIFFIVLESYMLYQMLVHLMLHPLFVYLVFRQKKSSIFFQDLFVTYGMMMFLGGIMNRVFLIVGQGKNFWLWGICGFVICIFFLHALDSTKLEELQYDVLLQTEKESFLLQGFLDTGNLLIDPILNQPVHIVEKEVLEKIFPKDTLQLRYIPFHSLGQENSILPVVTLKAMYLTKSKDQKSRPVYVEKPVFGLANEKLFQKRNYQIILNAKSIL